MVSVPEEPPVASWGQGVRVAKSIELLTSTTKGKHFTVIDGLWIGFFGARKTNAYTGTGT
jgi:hypothetical protein